MSDDRFVPGVRDYVLQRLAKVGGKEVDSRKFASPHSSAALVVNTSGRFIERPGLFPLFLGMPTSGSVECVDIFRKAVAGAAVVFHGLGYREWLASWGRSNDALMAHKQAIPERFHP